MTHQPMTEAEITALVKASWGDLSERAAARTARRIGWSRWLARINLTLAAAAVVMVCQAGWNAILVVRLDRVADGLCDLVRLTST